MARALLVAVEVLGASVWVGGLVALGIRRAVAESLAPPRRRTDEEAAGVAAVALARTWWCCEGPLTRSGEDSWITPDRPNLESGIV